MKTHFQFAIFGLLFATIILNGCRKEDDDEVNTTELRASLSMNVDGINTQMDSVTSIRLYNANSREPDEIYASGVNSGYEIILTLDRYSDSLVDVVYPVNDTTTTRGFYIKTKLAGNVNTYSSSTSAYKSHGSITIVRQYFSTNSWIDRTYNFKSGIELDFEGVLYNQGDPSDSIVVTNGQTRY